MPKVESAPEMEPGWLTGVIIQADRRTERGFVFIRDGHNDDYFAHKTVFDSGMFADLVDGQAVTFRWASTTKGRRAYDVRPATAAEAALVGVQEENRGNR